MSRSAGPQGNLKRALQKSAWGIAALDNEEVATLRQKLASAEAKLAAVLSLLPDSLPIVELQQKREEIRETLGSLVLAWRYLKGFCAQDRAANRLSPRLADAEAFLARLERRESFQAHLQALDQGG